MTMVAMLWSVSIRHGCILLLPLLLLLLLVLVLVLLLVVVLSLLLLLILHLCLSTPHVVMSYGESRRLISSGVCLRLGAVAV